MLDHEPVRRPDSYSPAHPWAAPILLACVVGTMLAFAAAVAPSEADRAAAHAAALRRHEMQTKACVAAGGVPYFHEVGQQAGLFRWCDLP